VSADRAGWAQICYAIADAAARTKASAVRPAARQCSRFRRLPSATPPGAAKRSPDKVVSSLRAPRIGARIRSPKPSVNVVNTQLTGRRGGALLPLPRPAD
jgi:hypothetical protein